MRIAIAVVGTWSNIGGFKETTQFSARLAFAFFGDEATLTMGTGPDHSIYDIYIDGSLWQSIDGYAAAAGTRSIVMTTGIDGRKLATEGLHTVELRNRAERHSLATGYKLRFQQVVVADKTYTAQTIRYSYDKLARVREARYAAGVNGLAADADLLRRYQYAFDLAGNRTQQSVALNGAAPTVTNYTYNAGNQLTGITGFTYEFDNNGNVTAQKSGATTVESYSWDRANRLVGSTINPTSYNYDGAGNLIGETVSGVLTRFLYDVQPGLAQLLSQTTGSTVTRHVHAPRGVHARQASAGTWNWVIQDGLGSVVREVTDAFAMPTTADFDPFGVRTSNSATPFGFTGEHTLQGNSIVYLRARSYMPHLGVFMSLDPLETANRYAYAGGNPVNAVDPSGMVYERPERWHRCSSLSTNSSRQLHMSQGGSFYSQPYEPCAENCSLQMLSGADFEACVENCRRIGIDPWQITPDLQNKILFSSVTLAVIKRDEMCNTIDDVFLDIHQRQGRCTPTQQSIGTVIEGGILTHTHFDRANEDDSNANFLFLNENYDWLFIEGVAFQDVLPIKDITLGISSYGTMLLSLPYPTGRFGYTARLASIDYPNTRPGWVFFAFVPGDNGTAWYEGNMKGYSAHSTLQVGVAGVYGDNPARRHEFLLIGDYTTEGDSGGGHFDQYGNLVGVLRGAENAGLIPGTGNFFNPLRQAVTKVR